MRRYLWKIVLLVYVISTFFSYNYLLLNQEGEQIRQDTEAFNVSATDLGVMCISSAYPTMAIQLADSRDNETSPKEGKIETLESITTNEKEENIEKSTGEPRVLIIHTHATESYLPSSEGNFHTRNEENTVRDVGNVVKETLEAKGIGVIHDKTLHDYPSYNDSYYRSYETAAALLKKYPTIECVIDLHRDAVASAEPAATVSIGGKTCAKYSYVIGTAAQTYSQNKAFIGELNKVAATQYSGFTGAVMERGYRYNQDLSTKYLLLEIGFNRNQIEDCRNTARVFGNVLAETLNKG